MRTVSSYAIYVFARDPPPLQLKVGAGYMTGKKNKQRSVRSGDKRNPPHTPAPLHPQKKETANLP